MEITCGKRKMGSNSFGNSRRPKTGVDGNEEELCKDVLESILERLNFLDLARAKLVCSDWYSVSKVVENSYAQCHPVPWLLVPDKNNFCLFNLEEKRSFNLKTNIGFDFSENPCHIIGSSHGCLIYLDGHLRPIVLNPLTGSIFHLPLLSQIVKYQISSDAIDSPELLTQHYLRAVIVKKAVLSSNPSNNSKNYSVALIYGWNWKLAYFNAGNRSWTRLDQEKKRYTDIIFHESKLYAVEDGSTHVIFWDFSGSFPEKLTKLEPTKPAKLSEGNWKLYLVASRRKILLVTRKIADHVDENGNEVIDPDMVMAFDEHDYASLPYRTMSFCVYELDMLKQQWVETKSLDGCAVFLGGNHSLSVSTQQELVRCDDNSIYFTDDNWLGMDEYWSYGGHDRGVFNINDGRVRMFDDFGSSQMEPSPCWIAPHVL